MFRILAICGALLFTSSISASHVDILKEITLEPTVSAKFTTLYVNESTVDIGAGGCRWLFGSPQFPNHCKKIYTLLVDKLFTQDQGGHEHFDEDKPVGTLKINGVETDTYEYFSNTDTEHTLTYTASPFSGDVVLKTSNCTNEGNFLSNPCFNEYRLIHVKKTGLTRLTASTNYTLIGGSSTGNTIHPYNHFANANMTTFINKLSKEWIKSNPRLRINDISLKSGGHFDVGGTWTVSGTGHKQHIFGNDVDIAFVGKTNEPKFKKLVHMLGNVRFYLVHNNHHHISLYR